MLWPRMTSEECYFPTYKRISWSITRLGELISGRWRDEGLVDMESHAYSSSFSEYVESSSHIDLLIQLQNSEIQHSTEVTSTNITFWESEQQKTCSPTSVHAVLQLRHYLMFQLGGFG